MPAQHTSLTAAPNRDGPAGDGTARDGTARDGTARDGAPRHDPARPDPARPETAADGGPSEGHSEGHSESTAAVNTAPVHTAPVHAPVHPPVHTAPSGTTQDGTLPASTEHQTAATAEEQLPWTPPSWDEVVREHADRVFRLAFRLSGNKHDAEDLTQDTFIRVFRSLASYKPGTFEGWLHRITTNLFLDLARRRSRLRMEGLPEDTDRLPSTGPSPEQVYQDTHLDPDLQAALDELPPEFRAAVVLCDVEGLSYEEIGTTLDVKLGTVRSRIHRGRQMLKAAMETRREPAREESE